MYDVKMMFTLIQVGTNLWVNPMQVQGIVNNPSSQCSTIVLMGRQSDVDERCSDWAFDKVKDALSTRAVSRAMENK